MAFIEDGQGSGNKAGVTSENMIKTLAITQSMEHHVNVEEGRAYHLPFVYASTGTGDSTGSCFLYIKNSDEKDMVIEGFSYATTGVIQVVKGVSGTPGGGAAIVPSNVNFGSGRLADGTFYGSTKITGLTKGTVVDRVYCNSANESKNFNFELDVVLPKNSVLCLYTTGIDKATYRGTFNFIFHD